MSNIELVINISEEQYEKILNIGNLISADATQLIRDGIPLEEDEDCISRSDAIEFFKDDVYVVNELNNLAPVIPKQRTGYISIDDVMSVFDDFMCGEVDEDRTDTFLEMLKDKAEGSGEGEVMYYPQVEGVTPTVVNTEALEQQPCEDAIGRSDMLDAIGHGTTYTSAELQRIIKGLPPVYPQPKTGYWIRELIRNEKGGCIGAEMICSECGNDNKHDEYMSYCPNCGTKMIKK